MMCRSYGCVRQTPSEDGLCVDHKGAPVAPPLPDEVMRSLPAGRMEATGRTESIGLTLMESGEEGDGPDPLFDDPRRHVLGLQDGR